MEGLKEALEAKTVLHGPGPYHVEEGPDGTFVVIDSEGPNWIGTDARGVEILGLFDGVRTLDDVVWKYSSKNNVGLPKAWLHVHTFVRDALRQGFLSTSAIERRPYEGRGAYLSLERLNKMWIHTNNSCNLSCAHCLVKSSPSGDRGLPAEMIMRAIDEARGLGVTQFYLTGGEPFLRADFFKLVGHIIRNDKSRLTVLTNGTILGDVNIQRLKRLPLHRLHLQISLDGSCPEVNDPIRGKGSFHKIVAGIKHAVRAGIRVTVSTVVTSQNVGDLSNITKLLATLEVSNHHFLYMHHRGRALEYGKHLLQVPMLQLIESMGMARETGVEVGVTIDNLASIRMRVDSPRFTRYDLSDACWGSLCLYSNGEVYPSAALAGYQGLSCGNISEASLERIWRNSSVCKEFRQATLLNKPTCKDCHLRFICGGGDMEHSYLYPSSGAGNMGLSAEDPYCELYRALILNTMHDLTSAVVDTVGRKSGFDAPVIFRGMGEGAGLCSTDGCGVESGGESEFNLRMLSSNCVLAQRPGAPRHAVREFYASAAKEPQEGLCCVGSLDAGDTAHIPEGVLKRAYGCGSPVGMAAPSPGERVLDLGSGAGIDCFIAAKKVGPSGKVIGIDMTDEMLDAARGFNTQVAKNLGYDVVDFRKGFLEEVPVESRSVDVILSNCVINLSPDKRRVFREMWRVLDDHGRIVVSDIVSSEKVPAHLRADKLLWGQCLGGALTEEEFLAYLEQAGFYGIETLSRTFWKELEGCRFFSITVRAYKYEKRLGCNYQGHRVVYLGPHKAVVDEEGHLFPRGEEVEVCTDTAEKLKRPPYLGCFAVIEPSGDVTGGPSCQPHSKDNKCC